MWLSARRDELASRSRRRHVRMARHARRHRCRDGTLVAAGGMGIYDSAGTWTSQDRGDTWVGHPNEDQLFTNGTIQGLAVFGDKVLAVGSLGDNASIWVGTVGETGG